MGAVESHVDESHPPGYDETKHTTRIVCLAITLTSNISLFLFMVHKILIKKEKKINPILAMAMFYISCTIFASFYNLLYRWTIGITKCPRSDVFEELLIAFVRSVLLLFYVIMIQKIFANSKQAIRKKVIQAFIAVIVVFHLILLPSIYISQQTYYALQTPSYGVYCRNDTSASPLAFACVVIYQVLDASITIVLMVMFVIKLNKLLKYLEGDEKNEKHEETVDEDGNAVETRRISATERAEQSVQKKTQFKLLKLVKKSLTLTVISVISSWIIIFAGRIDSKSKFAMRWVYPLDYLFNAWCIFLLFDWREFKWCDCECFESKYVETRSQTETTINSTQTVTTTTIGIGSTKPVPTPGGDKDTPDNDDKDKDNDAASPINENTEAEAAMSQDDAGYES